MVIGSVKSGAILSTKLTTLLVWVVEALCPAASKIELASVGTTVIVSTPPGVPVIFKNIRITVSPPESALARPSVMLSSCLRLLIVTAVAVPPFGANVKLKSSGASAPLPLPLLNNRSPSKVTSM